MEALLRELLPHDPNVGLFVAPDIPPKKLDGALSDYAKKLRHTEVVALYDGTLLGNARDGVVFASDRLVFQNSNLEPAHEVMYVDLVAVRGKRQLLGGQRIEIDVNRGRATIELSIDFSGKPAAATYVVRFLEEAIQHVAAREMDEARSTGETDIAAVERALDALVREGKLAPGDRRRLLDALIGPT
jgi:hypothetical protein